MKTIGKFGILFCLGAAFSYGEVWQAKVLDASCYDTQKTGEHKSGENLARECAATASTTDFAIQTSDGKVYRVNSSGNAELAKDIRDGVLKKDKDGDIHANITGSREGETVSVTSINLEKK
ncbi:MAG TPA: hypothetical protein VGQ49_15985 [Bryobacteraceae bacterium]|jgi:hypothetical protein|nr:hypothetical protein [Bryobacteraceae bacterium]